MQTYRPEQLLPKITQVRYWREKELFMMDEDRYERWVLFAVEDGSFQFEIGEERGLAVSGDVVLCPPGTLFRRKVVRLLTFFVINFVWQAGEEQPLAADDRLLSALPAGKLPIYDMQRLFANYFYMKKVWQLTDPISIYRQNYLLHDIWQLYCMKCDAVGQKPIMRDPLMEEAMNRMEERVFERFSMKELSAELGLSAVQFTRRFRAAVRTTPSDYVASLRLNKARALLAESSLTLEQIASLCGYENGFYLSRVFSKKIKMSPSEYRRSHQI
jgi:AraC-like DNA-binding protein